MEVMAPGTCAWIQSDSAFRFAGGLPLRGKESRRSEKRRRKRERQREREYPASWIRFVHQIESVELRVTDEWLNTK